MFITTESYALSTCDSILQHGIYDQRNTLNNKQKHELVKSSWCRTNEKERSGGLGFTIFKKFGFNGKGKKADVSKYCSSSYNQIKNDTQFSEITKLINADIVRAWSSCIQSNEGQVSHYIKPSHDPRRLIYGIVFKPNSNGTGARQVKLNYWAVSGAKCPVNFNGKTINHNIFEVTCIRAPEDAVIINARSSDYGHNLRSAQIPAFKKDVPIENPRGRKTLFSPKPGASYFIQARHSNKCIHVRGPTSANREPLWTWDCVNRPEFLFNFEPAGQNWFRVKSNLTNKCFHIKSASYDLRAPMWQWDCTSRDHFLFKFTPSNIEGYYKISAKHSGLCLHVKSASMGSRAPLWQWGCTDALHFLFRFTEQLPQA